MRTLVLILFLLPAISFAQKKDYKNYDKAVAYFHEGKVEKAKKLTEKILVKNADWTKPNLLMASIYADLGDIEGNKNNIRTKVLIKEYSCIYGFVKRLSNPYFLLQNQ